MMFKHIQWFPTGGGLRKNLHDFLCFFSLLVSGTIVGFDELKAQSPGGVAGAVVWFKADQMTVANNSAAWTDQAGTAIGGSTFNSVDVIADRNFHPVLRINNTGDNILFNRPFNPCNAMTVFVVFSTTNTTGEVPGGTHWRGEIPILSADIVGGTNDFGLTMGAGRLKWWSDSPNAQTLVAGSATGGYNNGLLNMASFTRSSAGSNTVNLFANGALVGTGSHVIAGNLVGFTTWGINQHVDNSSGGVDNMRVAEVVVYDSELGAASLRSIETYLAIKHGITMTRDYTGLTASNLYAIAGYSNEIFGIGRHDASGLMQKQSRPGATLGTNDDIAIYHGSGFGGTYPLSNSSNANSFAIDNQYLITGNDGGAVTFSANYMGVPNTLLGRTYKITDNGGVGTVTVGFDNATFTGLSSGSKYFFGVSNDATFDNSDTWVEMTEIGTTGDFYVEHDFSDNGTQFFTIRNGGSFGPGGVSADLEGWWRADMGTNGTNVNTWDDQSPFTRQMGRTAGTVTLNDGGVNFNPYLDLSSLSKDFGTTGSLTVRTMVVVSRNISNTNTTNNSGLSGVDGSPGYRFDNANAIKEGGQAADWCNGGASTLREDGTLTADGGTTAPLTQWKILTGIKSTDASGQFFVGGFNHPTNDPNPNGLDIAEAIVYRNSTFAGNTRQQVESYLAIKYGITLSPATYYKADATVIYNDATYNNRVFGIGRDDRSMLNQKQSSTILADSVVTIGLSGVLAATNALNTATFPTDGSFLLIGDNNGGNCWSNAEISVAGSPREYWRVLREWKYTVTGNIPSVVIRVDSVAGTFALPPLPTGSTTYQLLLDGDGNFASGAQPFTMTRVSGQSAYEVVLSAADLGAGGFFTVGTRLARNLNFQSVCNSSDIFFYGSNLELPGSCISLVGPVTSSITSGPSNTPSTYFVVENNPGTCIDTATWTIPTLASGIYRVNTFSGGCGVTAADLVTQDTIVLSAPVASGTLEVNGSTDAFLCLGDPNAVLSGSGGFLGVVTLSGSGTFATLIDSANFASTGFATLFVHSGNVGHHKVFLGVSGCNDADTVDVYIGVPSPSSLSYPVAAVCEQGTPISPTIGPGTYPGSFSSTPTGLSINPSTGVITPTSSNPGSYFVTFNPSDSTCRTNSTAGIVVYPPDSAVFSYPSTYCINDTNPLPVFSIPVQGTFSISGLPGGAIDTLTGEILLQNASAGTAVVSFNAQNTCGATTTATILFNAPPNVNFVLADSVCDNSNSGFVDATGLFPSLPAGQFTWSSPVPGAVVFSQPGRINLQSSTPGGPHPVAASYTDQATGCTGTHFEYITIVDVMPVSLSYGAQAFCQKDISPTPSYQFTAAGGYFTSSAGLQFVDSTTGLLDLAASTPGNYTISYVPPYPACASSPVSVATITVKQSPNASFTMPPTVCRSDSSVSLTVVENGQFNYRISFGSPTNNSTIIADPLFDATGTAMSFSNLHLGGNLFLFAPTTYLVQRVLTISNSTGFCSDTAYDYFYLAPNESSEFDYLEELYCQSESDPVPFIFGQGGGTFLALDGAIVDDTTGQLSLTQTPPGTYVVQYSTVGNCPSTSTDTLQILPGYRSYFRYPLSEVCTRRDTLSIDTSFTPLGAPQQYFHVSGIPQVSVDPVSGMLTGMSQLNFNGSVEYVIGHATGDINSCPDTTFTRITLTAPDASFNIEYGAVGIDTFCGRNTIIPTITSSSGFVRNLNNPAGLIYSNQGNEGEVNLQYSSPDQGYTVLMTNRSVCRDTAINRFYIRGLDDARFSYGTTEACSGDGILLPDTIYTTPGVFYYVPSFSGASLALDPVTGAIDLGASTQNSSYRVYYRTLGACRDTMNILMEVNASPEIDTIESNLTFSFCVGADPVFECQGQGDVRWFLNGTLIGASRELETENVNNLNLQDGDTLRAILSEPSSGCSDTSEVQLQVLPLPVAFLSGNDSVLEAQGPFFVEIGTDRANTLVTWTMEGLNLILGQIAGISDTLAPGLTYLANNTMNVDQLLDPAYLIVSLSPRTFGCTGLTQIDTLTILPGGAPIFVPEVITPNDDGKNDVWLILYANNIDPTAYTVEVYNRAGARVHTQSGLSGTWAGDGMPDGVYWWIIRDASSAPVLKGGLTIRRN
jgi:gliding motility-associated-like protein